MNYCGLSDRALAELREDARDPAARWLQPEHSRRFATTAAALAAFAQILHLVEALPAKPQQRRTMVDRIALL